MKKNHISHEYDAEEIQEEAWAAYQEELRARSLAERQIARRMARAYRRYRFA